MDANKNFRLPKDSTSTTETPRKRPRPLGCWRGFARTLKQHLNFEEPRLQQKCGGELFGVRCRFCYRFEMTLLESDFLSTRTDYCEAERKWIVGFAAPVLVAQTICGFSGWGLDSFRSEGCCHSIFQISEVGLGHLRLLSIQSFGILKWVLAHFRFLSIQSFGILRWVKGIWAFCQVDLSRISAGFRTSEVAVQIFFWAISVVGLRYHGDGMWSSSSPANPHSARYQSSNLSLNHPAILPFNEFEAL